MKHARIATLALIAALTFGVGLSRAEDQAPAAVPPAPADSAPQAVEPVFGAAPGGCMPDGGCCGSGACAHHAAAADKSAKGAATGDAAGTAADTGGGCPCAKMKKKAM